MATKCETCGKELKDKAFVGIFGAEPVADALRDYPIHPDLKHYFCPGDSLAFGSECFNKASEGHKSSYCYQINLR